MFSLNLDPHFHHIRLSRFWNHHFGSILDAEDFSSSIPREPRNFNTLPPGFLRPWYSSSEEFREAVTFSPDKFEEHVDVQQFKPDEIAVKVVNDTVTVEGRHEEVLDEHGYVSRFFVGRYVLPEGYDAGRVESKLSCDGVLTITAPKVNEKKDEFKMIPVIRTGKSVNAIEPDKMSRK